MIHSRYTFSEDESNQIRTFCDEFGLVFVVLALSTWEIFPSTIRCKSWLDMEQRLLRWTELTELSRAEVANTWTRVWTRELESHERSFTLVLDALETLAPILLRY